MRKKVIVLSLGGSLIIPDKVDHKFLKEFKNTDKSSFTNNYRDLQASKYSLLEITEACIDIANHIIASKAYRRAEKYSEMFEILSSRFCSL